MGFDVISCFFFLVGVVVRSLLLLGCFLSLGRCVDYWPVQLILLLRWKVILLLENIYVPTNIFFNFLHVLDSFTHTYPFISESLNSHIRAFVE